MSEYGTLDSVKPLYKQFKAVCIADLKLSTRLAQRGLTDVLCEITKYCFSGDVTAVPADVTDDLTTLLSYDTALVTMDNK